MRGVFRKKIEGRNFGFIEGDDERDYFVYWNDFVRSSVPFRNTRVDDTVEFEPVETPNGPKAVRVLVIRENGVHPQTKVGSGSGSGESTTISPSDGEATTLTPDRGESGSQSVADAKAGD